MKLKVSNLIKKFGTTQAVSNLSFELTSGEIVGFIGPNGAGKTTTLRILSTLSLPSYGDATIDGKSIIELPEFARQHIGFVPDSLPLERDISVHEYLDFFARAYGKKGTERAQLIEELEEFTNLSGIKSKLLYTLSKGMKQRVTLARALINNPNFLLMDEPAAGLDPRARIELRELLVTLSNQGKGILISSHILSELSEICSSAVFIEQGRLLKCGSIEKLVDEVNNEEISKTKKIFIRVLDKPEELAKELLITPNIESSTLNKTNIAIDFSGNDEEAAELLKLLINKDYKIIEFRFQKRNLESLFMDITKGEVQ